MKIIEVKRRINKPVLITKAEYADFKLLTKARFSFMWRDFRKEATIHKLQIEGSKDILGVIGLVDWEDEKRIEIKLIATSVENMGKLKRYDGIAGCLIAFTCREALARYGVEACVSLVPKTQLTPHYIQKYHMKNAGRQLFLDGSNLIKLLKEYL
jgi:hypothetical protein